MFRLSRLFLSCFLFCTASLAQQPTELVGAADRAYQNKNWPEAERLYGQLTENNPEIGRYWYRLGVSQHHAGHNQDALATLLTARAKGVPPAFVGYAMADVYAGSGDKEKAFVYLDEAIKKGFSQPDQLTTDTDLLPLKSDPRFTALIEQTKRNQAPCEYSAENRQFDFWIGEWQVISTNGGSPQGESHIEKTLGGCAIWENWTSLGTSYAGKSYNVYNVNLKRWEQFWVDNAGGTIHFCGGLKDGIMDYWTDDIPQPDGTSLRRHLQFFSQGPDKVRQFSQGSTDGGKTWHVEYDLTYLRKKPAQTT